MTPLVSSVNPLHGAVLLSMRYELAPGTASHCRVTTPSTTVIDVITGLHPVVLKELKSTAPLEPFSLSCGYLFSRRAVAVHCPNVFGFNCCQGQPVSVAPAPPPQ